MKTLTTQEFVKKF